MTEKTQRHDHGSTGIAALAAEHDGRRGRDGVERVGQCGMFHVHVDRRSVSRLPRFPSPSLSRRERPAGPGSDEQDDTVPADAPAATHPERNAILPLALAAGLVKPDEGHLERVIAPDDISRAAAAAARAEVLGRRPDGVGRDRERRVEEDVGPFVSARVDVDAGAEPPDAGAHARRLHL